MLKLAVDVVGACSKTALGGTAKLAVSGASAAVNYINATPEEAAAQREKVRELGHAVTKVPARVRRRLGRKSEKEKRKELSLVAEKTDSEVPCLAYSAVEERVQKGVFLVTCSVEVVSSNAIYKYVAKRSGLSLASVSHWSVVVIDPRGYQSTRYDLMSETDMPRNELRVTEVTPEIIKGWSQCVYIGCTTDTDAEIREKGQTLIENDPIYDIVWNQCQTFAEKLIHTICDGPNCHVFQSTLHRELAQAVPSLALFTFLNKQAADSVRVVARETKTEVGKVMDDIRELRLALKAASRGKELPAPLTT